MIYNITDRVVKSHEDIDASATRILRNGKMILLIEDNCEEEILDYDVIAMDAEAAMRLLQIDMTDYTHDAMVVSRLYAYGAKCVLLLAHGELMLAKGREITPNAFDGDITSAIELIAERMSLGEEISDAYRYACSHCGNK